MLLAALSMLILAGCRKKTKSRHCL
ncbi:MAG: hypothetical protein J6W12_06110 [Bacteroidales bacterium]|nr:hypothetical protein [Bacteroidales bacterium]